MLSHAISREDRASLFPFLSDTYDPTNRISRCTSARSPSANANLHISAGLFLAAIRSFRFHCSIEPSCDIR